MKARTSQNSFVNRNGIQTVLKLQNSPENIPVTCNVSVDLQSRVDVSRNATKKYTALKQVVDCLLTKR